jgi:glucokinase
MQVVQPQKEGGAEMRDAEYLGIDIGGTSTKYARVDVRGGIGEKGSFETFRSMSRDVFLREIFQVCDAAASEGVQGIGISSLGVIDSESGRYLGALQNLPALQGLNLKTALEARYPGLPVVILNDAHAAAVGELWVGEGRDCSSLLCITLGTGIGGALVLNGKLVHGFHNRAGEIGYSDYQSDREFAETHFSTEAVMSKISEKIQEPMDGFKFFRRCYNRETEYLAALEGWMRGVARLIANLCLLVDPQKVLIGGGISGENELIIPLLTRLTDEMLPAEFRGQTVIAPAGNSCNAGILGAAAGLILKDSR